MPPYDLDALLVEVELLLDWYAGHVAKASVRVRRAHDFRQSVARAPQPKSLAAPPTWTLRDYHSPNLHLAARIAQGLARIGIIDFQDCVLGHPGL